MESRRGGRSEVEKVLDLGSEVSDCEIEDLKDLLY